LEQQFPDLIDNVEFCFAFFDDEDLKLDATVYEFLCENLPPSVFSDTTLALKIFSYDPKLYCALVPGDWKLKHDQQIVKAVLELDSTLVDVVSGPLQLQNPYALGHALAGLPLWHTESVDYIGSFVDSEAWNHREVVLGWVKGGGELHDAIPRNLREDPEILLIAMGNMYPTALQGPDYLPHNLASSVDFMMKAVEKNPRMLVFVAASLKGRKDLMLAALSGKHDFMATTTSSLSGFYPDELELIPDADEGEIRRSFLMLMKRGPTW